GDGETVLKAALGEKTAEARVKVAGADQRPPVSFRHDVMPVFMRAGCNAGGCHGAARGKDGFRLSLFGYDPAGDYHRITREQAVRRINLALPEQSLLLLKATGAVPHTGGRKVDPDSVYARWIRDWIAAGAASDVAEAPAVERVELF